MRTSLPWIVLVLVFAAGCSGDAAKKARNDKKAAPSGPSPSPAGDGKEGSAPFEPSGSPAGDGKKGEDKAPAPAGQAPVVRKIVYTAEVALVVEDLTSAEGKMLELLDRNQGLVAKSAITGSAGAPRQGRWTLRVPVARMRSFLQAVVKLGVPETNTTDSEDVTEKYYDLEASVKNYRSEETALRKLLEQSAGKVEDVLAFRRELAQLREKIDHLEGQRRRLANLTALSTITLTLREVKNYVPPEAPPEPPPPTFGSTVSSTFAGSVAALVALGKAVVLVAVAVAPWLPLVALLTVPTWVLVRRLRRRRPRPVEQL